MYGAHAVSPLPAGIGGGGPAYIYVQGPNGQADVITAAPADLPEGLSYDAASNILTLDNVILRDVINKQQTLAGIIVQGGSELTIRLIGSNVIYPFGSCSYGIYSTAEQETVITGDGSLVVNGPSDAAIHTDGELIIDSSVSLLTGFSENGNYKTLSANGGITIGGESYTGTLTDGAVVNGKVVDKVRKTALYLPHTSVGYGTEGNSFNPHTTSVSAEETGEGWGWNHETKTLTMSGAVLYSTGGFEALTLPKDTKINIELAEGTENAVIGSSGQSSRAIYGEYTDVSITGGGGLTALAGKATSASRAFEVRSLAISDSVRVTAIGGAASNVSRGLHVNAGLSISDSARVLCVPGEGGVEQGIFVTRGNAYISGNAQVEIRNYGSFEYGLFLSAGNAEISGGTVKVSGGSNGFYIIGDYGSPEEGNIQITGGSVTAETGILVRNNLTITGGSVTAVGKNDVALKSTDGAVTIAPAEKQLAVYGGEAAPGAKLALVTAPEPYTLTNEQLASQYIRIVYEPMERDDRNVNAVYIPGGPMETVYSVDVIWGSMEFIYSTGYEGVWNPENHQLDGVVPEGWSCKEGADVVQVVNHSNAPVDVGFIYMKAEGFDAVTGVFDNTGEKLPSAIGTAADAAPKTEAVLTLSGKLSDSATNKTQIGTVTVSVNAAAAE